MEDDDAGDEEFLEQRQKLVENVPESKVRLGM